MKSYLVRWEIDMEADSPEEAATKALIVQRDQDPENSATVFDVGEKGTSGLAKSWKRIDLSKRPDLLLVCVLCGKPFFESERTCFHQILDQNGEVDSAVMVHERCEIKR